MDIDYSGTRNSLEALMFKPIALLLLNRNLNNGNKLLEIKAKPAYCFLIYQNSSSLRYRNNKSNIKKSSLFQISDKMT